MKKEYIDAQGQFTRLFFQDYFKPYGNNSPIEVQEANYFNSNAEQIAVKEKYQQSLTWPRGIKNYQLQIKVAGELKSYSVIVKSKQPYQAYADAIVGIFLQCGINLSEAELNYYVSQLPFVYKSDIREIEIYRLQTKYPILHEHMPLYCGDYVNVEEGIYTLIEKELSEATFACSPVDYRAWHYDTILAAINGAAKLHSVWYGKVDQQQPEAWIGYVTCAQSQLALLPFWQAMKDFAVQHFDCSTYDALHHQQLLDSLATWWGLIDTRPKTLIYNDFTLKNTCVTPEPRVYFFDWELAIIQIPERDVCEFLTYVLPEDFSEELLFEYIQHHRLRLEAYSGIKISDSYWLQGYLLALYDMLIDRLSFYIVVESVEARNVAKLYRTTMRMITFIKARLEK